ncbi:Myb-like DNA-binding domain-containing protein [Spironucleus salmonicida]|uniref:Myb-like DNA-binding domain-containing protein n=1 Tax=Spironucleus salmonicida TaxID=348837 RepID=A0A9P8LMR1_9EUKA|nr:Myb-like DNA-binding domain-containing protein [Spironucleus salmonicida]
MDFSEVLEQISGIIYCAKTAVAPRASKPMRASTWTAAEDATLSSVMRARPCTPWADIAAAVSTQARCPLRAGSQVSQHWRRVLSFRLGDDAFSAEEDHKLRLLRADGLADSEIAAALATTELAVRLRAVEMGLSE